MSYTTIDELLKELDELKSMAGSEICLIKRALDQLELVLSIKEKQLEDNFKQIENYKKTVAMLDRQLKKSEEYNRQLVKEKNENEKIKMKKENFEKDFFSFIQ